MGHFAIAAMLLAGLPLPAAQVKPADVVRVYPGARGFGVRTPAGRGGRLVRVTNLSPLGPGSLREALAGKGARLVVFEVGGVIDLQGNGLVVTEPFLTIAGQTAPSPGITVIRGGLSVRTHDVLIRHLRVRMGDAGRKKGSGWEPEVALEGADAYNIVIDHCSLSWGVEANLATRGPQFEGPQATARNLTISNSIIAEALADSTHSHGAHSVGAMVSDNSTDVAFIGNLFAHNQQRNPQFRANTTGVVVNNVLYNPGRTCVNLDWSTSDWAGKPSPHNSRVSVVGNVLLYGPDTVDGVALVSRKGDAYLSDNLAFDLSGTPAAITAGLINVLPEAPVWPRGLRALPADKVLEAVLRHAGARPKERDAADQRVVTEVQNRKGKVINSQDDVGGYPKPAMTRRRLIAPADDLDDWLAKLAAEIE